MKFTFFDSHYDKRTHRSKEGTWPEVLDFLSTHQERDDKVGSGFSPAEFRPTCDPGICGKGESCPGMQGHAINANVVAVHMMSIDLDKGQDGQDLTEIEARQYIASLQASGVAFVAHTTHSYAPPKKSKWHVFLPLSRSVTGDEYRRVWRAALHWLGLPSGIPTDFPARFWNVPSCPIDGARDVVSSAGPHLDVGLMLTLADVIEPEKPQRDLSSETSYAPADAALLEAVRADLDLLGDAHEGHGGDPKTYAAARLLVNDWGLSEEEAWPLFEAWNDRACHPAWDATKLGHKMNMALSDPPTDRGLKREAYLYSQDLEEMYRPEPGSFSELLLEARNQWNSALKVEDAPQDLTPWFMSAADLMAMEFPPTPWLIKGLMTKGGVGAMATEPKAGKTWAATEYAISVASGTKCFNEFEVEQGQVAYFYAEDQGSAVQNRIKSLCVHRGGVPDDLHLQPRGKDLDICDDASAIMLLASAKRFSNLQLLVLDPLRDVHTGAEDSSDEMSQVMKRLRVLSRLLDCTVLFVHHTSKGGADVNNRRHGQRMRGSGAVHGALDHALYMYDTVNDGNLIQNKCATEVKGAKSAASFVLSLHMEDDPITNTAVAARWEVSEPSSYCDDEGVTEVIKAVGDFAIRKEAPPTEAVLHKHMGGPRNVLKRNLDSAKELGYIAQNMLGRVANGWILTTQGHSLFEGIAHIDNM